MGPMVAELTTQQGAAPAGGVGGVASPGVAVGLMLVWVEQQAPMAAAVVVGVWKLAARLVLEVGVQLPNWGVGVGVVGAAFLGRGPMGP